MSKNPELNHKKSNSVRGEFTKEIGSWISDYPKLKALKHPYLTLFAVFIGNLFVGWMVAGQAHSWLGWLVGTLMFIYIAYMLVNRRC